MEHIDIKRPIFFLKIRNFNLVMTLEVVIALGVVLAVLFLTWRRLFFGVDFTDEAFYIALQYRFSLGDIPIKDEQNIAQFAGVLLIPFTRLFLYFQGNTDGIVLFSRHLHFAFTMLVSLSVFIAIHRTFHWPVALMASVICVVFIPFNIHGLSYNTMGCGFLTIGCFLGIVDQGRGSTSRWTYFFSGFSHCLAILVYPPLLIAVCVYAVLMLSDRSYLRTSRMTYICGGLLAAIIPMVLILQAGVEALRPMVDYVMSMSTGSQGGGWKKMLDVIVDFWMETPLIGTSLVGTLWKSMVVLGIWHCFKPRWMRFILPFLPLILIRYTIGANGIVASLYFVVAISLLGPFIYFFVAHDNFGRKLFKLIWWPSFIGGLVTAWSSGNGAMNGAIGMFPAALATTLLMIRALQLMPSSTKIMRLTQSAMMMITPWLIIAPLLVGGYMEVYGETVASTSALTQRVARGPFRGIKTTVAKNNFINSFSRDFALFARPNDTVLFFYDFPAGYLFSNLLPATNSVWSSALGNWSPVDRTPAIEYYCRKGIKPSLVFKLKNVDVPGDLLVAMVRGKEYREIFDNDSYSIFRMQTEVQHQESNPTLEMNVKELSHVETANLSGAESWGRWTDGAPATFKFSSGLPKNFRLILRMNLSSAETKGKQVDVMVGEQKQSFVAPAAPETIQLDFKDVPKDADTVLLVFPSPRSPKEIGSAADPRKLGLALVSLEIAPLK